MALFLGRFPRNYIFSALVLGGLLFFLSGCFETEFNFDTQVHTDGSVTRKTRIEGQGATLFKVPQAKGWKAKTLETRGDRTLVPEMITHIQAEGHFKAGQEIPPDYEFDLAKQAAQWGEKDKKRLEEAGLKPPYEAQLFSRNQVRIQQIKGWFTVTTFYEETFQTTGLLALLFQDLKEQIQKEGEARGQIYQPAELEAFAKLRLEEEILPEFQFESQVKLPGKILSANGRKLSVDTAVWKFSMKDFVKEFSAYKLTASSEAFRPSGFLFVGVCLALLVFFFAMSFLGMKTHKKDIFGSRKPPKKSE